MVKLENSKNFQLGQSEESAIKKIARICNLKNSKSF